MKNALYWDKTLILVICYSNIVKSLYLLTSSFEGKGKGKAISLQAWTGPEDSRRLKLPDFKTIGT